jgi:hypothetical protein
MLLWKSNKYYTFWTCVCSLRNPACNARAPYCHLWSARLYSIFPHSHKRNDFLTKKIPEHNICVLMLSKNFVWHISKSNKNWAKRDHKCVLVFMYSNSCSFQILVELEYSWQIFEKYSDSKFHENLPSGSHRAPCRRKDMTKLLVALPNFADAIKDSTWLLFLQKCGLSQ